MNVHRMPLRDRLRQSTRDAILAAAATTFNGRDANAVRMEDIAAAAGVAVGTLYNYFRDRNALVAAVLQARTQGLLDALDDVVAAATRHRRWIAPGSSPPICSGSSAS